VLVTATAALTGCGGGEGAGTAPTATTGRPAAPAVDGAKLAARYTSALDAYAARIERAAGKRRRLVRLAARPPQLEAAGTDDPAYVDARATAQRVEAIARELRLIAASRSKADRALYTRLYGLAGDKWDEDFRRNKRFYDRVSPIVYDHKSTPARERRVQRLWDAYMRDELASWRRYRQRLGRVAARSELYRSFLAYEQMEVDVAIGFLEQFRRHLRRQPADRTQLGFYTSQATKFSPYVVPVPVMWKDDKRLIRGFVRSIGRLAGGRAASVGDAYRAQIVRRFVSPLRKAKYRDSIVTGRLWMLFRVRQLERTPDQAYVAARQTLLLEGIEDVRNPYGRLLAIYDEVDAKAGRRHIRPEMAAYLRWAHAELAKPTPPILAPTARAIDRGIEQLPKVRSRVLFQTYDDLVRAQAKIERAMRRGARRVDDPKQLKAALKQAVAATAPPAPGA